MSGTQADCQSTSRLVEKTRLCEALSKWQTYLCVGNAVVSEQDGTSQSSMLVSVILGELFIRDVVLFLEIDGHFELFQPSAWRR